MEMVLIKIKIRNIHMGGQHLDHTKEDRLLLGDTRTGMSKQKSFLPVHSNGNQLQIIPLLVSMQMVILSKLIYFQFSKNLKNNNFSIYQYSTASTEDAVYIIGGSSSNGVVRTIAEFKNGRWSRIGQMEKPKSAHGSISFGQKTLIFEGYSDDDHEHVELWDLKRKRKVSSFNAPHVDLYYGFGMFIVNIDFCQ